MRKSQLNISILVVRLSSVGDVVIASPFAEMLKRHYPNSRIVWAVQPDAVEILKNNPFVDDLFVFDKARWVSLLRQMRFKELVQVLKTIHKTLINEQFEVAYDLQGLFKSGLITWLSGAKSRIGLGSREGSHWFVHKMVSRNIANRSIVGSEYRYLINQLGFADDDWCIRLHTPENTEISAKKRLQERLAEGESYVALCPFANSRQKQWPTTYWEQLALRLRGRYQLRSIVLGAESDWEAAQELAKRCGVVNLCGVLSLQESSVLIQRASLTVGVENALTHVAQASDSPSIALFGPNCPYTFSGGANSKVIYLDKTCSPCHRPSACQGRFDCMQDISPDRVLTEIKQLLTSTQQFQAVVET